MDTITGIKYVDEDDFTVEIEVISDRHPELETVRNEIQKGIEHVDAEITKLDILVDSTGREIDRLTNHADSLDYTVAVGSGIITGVMDILFVKDFSLEEAGEWGSDKTNNFVIRVAKMQGYDGDDLQGAVKFLEDNFPLAADKATNDFGGGLQHHLRDFSHNPTIVGLFFSFLTQFTHKVYGTDVAGRFLAVELKESDLILVGNTFPEKVTFGIVNWFFHMVSDMAGSSSSIAKGSIGTGLPGPIVSLLKEMSALPIFKKMNSSGYKEFSVWISKLFNGTLLGERDENGKLIKAMKFDLRTEMGVGHHLAQQSIPVILNECVVRGFYFLRRLMMELNAVNITRIEDLRMVNWENTLPRNNRTTTMMAIDLADASIEAAIKSGGVVINPEFIKTMVVKVNFVGIGRFATSVGTEVSMSIEKNKYKKEQSRAMLQILSLSNAKLYYKNADLLCTQAELYGHEARMYDAQSDLWEEVERTGQAIDELYLQAEKVGVFYARTIAEMDESFEHMENLIPEVEKMNPGLIEEMRRRLK
jgi:hypothetical protein